MTEKYDNALLDGIVNDAKTQATEEVATAREDARKKLKENDARIQKALDKEETILNDSLSIMESRYSTLKQSAIRKNQLRRRTALYDSVMAKVDEKISLLPKEKNYPDLLLSWVVEGLIAIELDEVVINYGSDDPVNQKMLDNASKLVQEKIGKKVKVSLGSKLPGSRGIVVTSKDGRISFNDLISSKLRRYNREVNEIVEGTVCKKE